jgi:dCTP deaminase
MIVNRVSLLAQSPIKEMEAEKLREHGVSYGLAEVGYDIRLKQDVEFHPPIWHAMNDSLVRPACVVLDGQLTKGTNFTLASAMEEFALPNDLMGVVHDKSTWARQGLSVFNTVIEPGWKGFLTLELVYHGRQPLHLPSGAGIAQVVFHRLSNPASYEGKYQDQADQPVNSMFA